MTSGDATGTVETSLALVVTPEVSAVALALSEGALVAAVTQRSATSCTVTCRDVPAVTPVVADGTALVQFPALADGTSTCSVACGEDTAAHEFEVYTGDVRTAAELNSIATADALVGQILIVEDLDAPTGAPELAVVTGDVALIDNNTGAVTYQFPALHTVGGSLRLNDNRGLSTTEANADLEIPAAFPALATIGGELEVTGNGALTNLSLPSLASIGASMTVSGNGALTNLSLPSLASIGGSLTIAGNAVLTAISLRVLCNVGSSFVVGGGVSNALNSSLATFDICIDQTLTLTIDGDVFVQNRSNDLSCADLAEVCHATVAGSLQVRGEVMGDADAVCSCP